MADLDFLRTVGLALEDVPVEFKERVEGVCEKTYDTPVAAVAAFEALRASLPAEATSRRVSLDFLDVVLRSKIECLRTQLLMQDDKSLAPPSPKRGCRVGLENHTVDQTSLNKCYLNTCLKGMYLTPGLRLLFQKREDPVGLAVKKIFECFDSRQSGGVLSYSEEPLQPLISALAKDHPEIREARQYDATEVLSWIVGRPFIRFEERKERDTDGVTREVCFPTIDLRHPCDGIFIPIQIPDFEEPVNLQEMISGVVATEIVDPEAIRTSEHNRGRERQVMAAVERLGSTLRVLRTLMLLDELPPCLILQLNRPVVRLSEVDPTISDLPADQLRALVAETPPTIRDVVVTFPQRLFVPNERTEHQYELCMVAIHLGKTVGEQGAGHYFGHEPPREGRPWMRHEDEIVTPASGDVKRLNEHDGYILFYTLIR